MTHHLPDIIPEINRVIMLKGGKVFRDGAKEELLREATLRELFATGLEVASHDGYYHAW